MTENTEKLPTVAIRLQDDETEILMRLSAFLHALHVIDSAPDFIYTPKFTFFGASRANLVYREAINCFGKYVRPE
jgi:hypothetical protein